MPENKGETVSKRTIGANVQTMERLIDLFCNDNRKRVKGW